MNIQQFRYALEVYRCESINKAAHALFISQPALSQSIRDLENDLGFTIFERSNRGVRPTPEGHEFLDSIVNFVQTVEDIQNAYAHDRHPRNILRISSSRYSFVTSAVLDFYNKYFKDEPMYSIALHEVDCAQAIQDVASSRVDLGVVNFADTTRSHNLNDLVKKGISYELILKSNAYVTFRKDHPLSRLDTVRIQDIVEYPQVRISSRGVDPYDQFSNFNYIKYRNPHQNILADNRSQIYTFVGQTDAVALGVTSLEISRYYPDLVSRRIADDDSLNYIYAIRQAGKTLPPHHRAFLDILKSYADENPAP